MPIYALGALAPHIDPTAWVAPNASIIGQVRLAAGVSIWWNCTLRGDTDQLIVGENSNIQDGSVLHTDPGLVLEIGRNVTVGHNVILHGTRIGDGSLIGMGATLLNRSVIGKECIIGANTLIPEGKVIPDRSLVVGVPGRIIRTLTDEEVAKLARSAQHYADNAARYRRDLVECGTDA